MKEVVKHTLISQSTQHFWQVLKLYINGITGSMTFVISFALHFSQLPPGNHYPQSGVWLKLQGALVSSPEEPLGPSQFTRYTLEPVN